jgi:hypothetical protein
VLIAVFFWRRRTTPKTLSSIRYLVRRGRRQQPPIQPDNLTKPLAAAEAGLPTPDWDHESSFAKATAKSVNPLALNPVTRPTSIAGFSFRKLIATKSFWSSRHSSRSVLSLSQQDGASVKTGLSAALPLRYNRLQSPTPSIPQSRRLQGDIDFSRPRTTPRLPRVPLPFLRRNSQTTTESAESGTRSLRSEPGLLKYLSKRLYNADTPSEMEKAPDISPRSWLRGKLHETHPSPDEKGYVEDTLDETPPTLKFGTVRPAKVLRLSGTSVHSMVPEKHSATEAPKYDGS